MTDRSDGPATNRKGTTMESKTTLQRLRHRAETESGFTLIELLIVITILGILAAIVVFAVGTTGSNSAKAACQSDVKTVETALEASKAQSTSATYDGTIALLVTHGYLREAPSSSHYTIGTDGSGSVDVTPTGGTKVSLTPGGSVSAATACAGVS
jgi:prepilin-type N-terminal cleavage/methylation domain-containing protein